MRGSGRGEIEMKTIVSYPCAKINVGLQVVARRDDGFHELRTVMVPVPGYCDEMYVEFGSGKCSEIELELEGCDFQESVEENLVWRAYDALRVYSPLPVRVRLHKRIPAGAGLGGGSSDAASALRCFSSHCSKDVSRVELERIALNLGSDVPFFMRGEPCFAAGRGERLEPIKLPLRGMYLVLVTPRLHVSTKEAFGWITPMNRHKVLSEVLANAPIETWQADVTNDFLPELVKRYPLVCDIIERFQELGATFTSLSGSGPSVYGLFKHEIEFPTHTFVDCKVYVGML